MKVIGTIAVICMCFLMQSCFLGGLNVNAQLVVAASTLNKTCPMMVDKETRLDNAVTLPGKTFQYNYTLVNIDRHQTALDTNKFKSVLIPKIINTVKTNPDMKFFKDNKVTMAYNYVDKNGAFIMKLVVTPDQYAD